MEGCAAALRFEQGVGVVLQLRGGRRSGGNWLHGCASHSQTDYPPLPAPTCTAALLTCAS